MLNSAFGSIASSAMTFVVCVGISVAATTTRAEVTLRLGSYVGETDIRYSEGLQKFAQLVDKKTAGRIKVQVFGSSTLHPFDKSVDSVRAGVSDISHLVAAAIDKQRLPCANITHFLPLPIDWERHVELDVEYNELLKEELARQGLITVFNMNAHDQEWFFKTPINKFGDFNGRLVRSVGPVTTHVIKKWGGRPVFTAPTETYQAAERGVIDSMSFGVSTFSSWKLWKVIPNMVVARMFYLNIMYVMNKKKFDGLPRPDQVAIKEAGLEMAKSLKPAYERWVNEQVGDAVMKQGASAVALPNAERLRLIRSAGEGWNNQIEEACGPELGAKLRAMFKKYEG